MKHFLVFLLLFIGIGSVTAQNARITGTVKDNTGEAVIGANIKVKDSTGGTISVYAEAVICNLDYFAKCFLNHFR